MTNGNVGPMQTETLSDQVDVYQVRTLPRATARWPVALSHPTPAVGTTGGRPIALLEQLGVYRVTQVPGRPLGAAN